MYCVKWPGRQRSSAIFGISKIAIGAKCSRTVLEELNHFFQCFCCKTIFVVNGSYEKKLMLTW